MEAWAQRKYQGRSWTRVRPTIWEVLRDQISAHMVRNNMVQTKLLFLVAAILIALIFDLVSVGIFLKCSKSSRKRAAALTAKSLRKFSLFIILIHMKLFSEHSWSLLLPRIARGGAIFWKDWGRVNIHHKRIGIQKGSKVENGASPWSETCKNLFGVPCLQHWGSLKF